MKILIAHNTYQYRGGEDSVVEAEISLLRSRGHEVATYFRSNVSIEDMSLVSVATQTLWSSRTKHELTVLIREFQPNVIHAHNTFPLISPSSYWAAAQAGVPLVQTLHNFRLMCLNGLFLREGSVCEDCRGRVPWRGVAHKCYRGSLAASAVLAGMLTLHRGLGTYHTKVARYIALNDFCRNKFIDGGLPAGRIVVKPNFVDFPTPEMLVRRGLLFVGRLSNEKGVATLASAMAKLPDADLRIAGDGPQSALLNGLGGVAQLGSLPGDEVRREMNTAVAMVVPSIWYETFGLVIVEAFACGTPVIVSRIGALETLVREGETGLFFEPGNPDDLATKMAWALANPERMAEMGRKARKQYEAEFSADVNYRQLIAIYGDVIREAQVYESGTAES